MDEWPLKSMPDSGFMKSTVNTTFHVAAGWPFHSFDWYNSWKFLSHKWRKSLWRVVMLVAEYMWGFHEYCCPLTVNGRTHSEEHSCWRPTALWIVLQSTAFFGTISRLPALGNYIYYLVVMSTPLFFRARLLLHIKGLKLLNSFSCHYALILIKCKYVESVVWSNFHRLRKYVLFWMYNFALCGV